MMRRFQIPITGPIPLTFWVSESRSNNGGTVRGLYEIWYKAMYSRYENIERIGTKMEKRKKKKVK